MIKVLELRLTLSVGRLLFMLLFVDTFKGIGPIPMDVACCVS